MSLLQIRDPQTTPSGGWSYRADDGTMIEARTFNDLVINVMAFRAERGLPTHNLAEEIEDAICRQKNVRCRPRVTVVTPEGVRPVQVADVWRFLKTLLVWIAKDRSFVPQEEAERRAEICSSCPLQVTPIGCWGCTGAFALILAVIGDRRTRLDDSLRSCSVCGCENRSSAHIQLSTLQKISGNLEYPEWCWKRSEQ